MRVLGLGTLLGCVIVAASASGQAAKDEIAIVKQWNGAMSGETKAQRVVIRKADEWKKLWAKTHGNVTPPPAVPEVDFDKNMVLAVYQGQKGSGGYDVKIVKVVKGNKGVTAQVKETAPGKDDIVLTVITSPYHIVVVPKAEDVKFEDAK